MRVVSAAVMACGDLLRADFWPDEILLFFTLIGFTLTFFAGVRDNNLDSSEER